MFTDEDIRQIDDHGLTLKEVLRQLDFFNKPFGYLNLARPCTPGDGIKVVRAKGVRGFIETYEREAAQRDCLKFVPASGAASRMFEALLGFLNSEKEIMLEPFTEKARGNKDARDVLEFMEGIRKFAFFKDLKSVMAQSGLDIDPLLEKGQFSEIIRFLLKRPGLDYSNLPKGLIKFHKYEQESRTAFEEHLVESASYVSDRNGRCRLHFTVSAEHMDQFMSLLEKRASIYEKRYGRSFDITYSTQKGSTDTIAVDLKNSPFRLKNGRLLFRPGGHGSLIENLNDLKGDIVFIKNIDNVVCDRMKPETFKWKKILGGCLINLQSKVFGYLKELTSVNPGDVFMGRVIEFMRDELCLSLTLAETKAPASEKREALIHLLNRPIRVCGMVKNVGEPGGGPFWVRDKSGRESLQIVEMAQIDPASKAHQNILSASTHFNPVDLVCSVSDFEGRPFDLRKYMDPTAVFIARKSKDGRELRALEHPGLWNGAMAKWITVFVEVPIVTFNPVKTVNDLLRKEHQPSFE